ncbi:MAG: undecaprenyl-diphosphate phosphatase [Phycisphaerales bacterium]|jgi:undecaprenyl-diphosphatase|nr:undecaprenyl-diphosphate phosphatase [Phycisphaerales bacterium]
MDIIQAIILGIVEGITEYLPISSTGHLILAQSWMGLGGEADNAYSIVIQGGAILAVLGLYRKRVGTMIRGLFGKHKEGLKLAINLIIAFLPAGIFGPLFDDKIEALLFHPTPVVLALGIGGVLMLFAARWQRSAFHEGTDQNSFIDIAHLTWKRALIIGILQCVAMVPGTSRSMMTIVAGMGVGLRPKHAAEFSFLLGLPTLGGATVFKLIKNSEALATLDVAAMIVGIVVSFIAAAIAIKWLVAYLSKHGLALFGWYRIALAIVFAIGLNSGYFTLEGNNDSTTSPDGTRTSSTLPSVTLPYDHCLAFPVAIHVSPPTITGPTTDCQCPAMIS